MALQDLEYQLKRFSVGNDVFNKEELKRLQCIKDNYMLYSGKQSDVYLDDFLKRLELAGVKNSWVTYDKEKGAYEQSISWDSDYVKSKFKAVLQGINTLGGITDFYTSLLLNEGIEITSPDEVSNEWLNGTDEDEDGGWLDRVNFNTELNLGVTGGCIRGDYIFKLWKDDNKANISVIPAKNWLPLVHLEDKNKVKANAIIEQYNLDKEEEEMLGVYIKNEKRKSILKVIVYEKSFNHYACFVIKNGKIHKQVAWDSEILGELPQGTFENDNLWYTEDTGLEYPMLFRIPNKLSDVSVYGVADYTNSVKEQQKEICIRSTQIGRILDKNSDPTMFGSMSNLEFNKDGRKVFNSSGKYLTVDQGDHPPGYLTWEGNLESNFKAIENAKSFIYEELGVNSAALGINEDGLRIISGKAIERVLMRSLAEINKKKMIADPVIKKIIKCAYQIETGNNNLILMTKWDNGIPKSREERIDLIKKLLGENTPLIDIVSAIMELYKVNKSEAEQILDNIKAQNILNDDENINDTE